MNYHLAARNQRTTGFKVKRAVQFALLLAFCIWLLYQLKHPLGKTKDGDVNIQNKLGEGRGSGILGRKGNAGWWWWSSGGDSDLEEAEKEEDGAAAAAAAADDNFEQDRVAKAYEETFITDRQKLREKLATREGKQDQKEPGRQYEQSQIKDLYKGGFSKRGYENAPRSMTDRGDREDEKDPEREAKEPQINHEEDHTRTSTGEKNGEVKENNEGKGPENVVKTSGMDNATVPGNREVLEDDGVHAFHDENGVPPEQDVDNIVESMTDESSADKKILLRQGVTSSPNNQGIVVESVPREEIEARKVDAGRENNIVVEDSEIDAAAEAAINSRTSLNNDGSNINPASEEA